MYSNEKYKSIIVENGIDVILKKTDEYYHLLDETGSLFFIVSTEYSENGNVINDFFDIIREYQKKNYSYVNTIVYPNNSKKIDNISYIVWLCKSVDDMDFNKDIIRENHIWKNVEWGKRVKNYNPKGKDPGNVWIPTEDNGKGKIIKHIQMNHEQVIQRLKMMSNSCESCLHIINKCREKDFQYVTFNERTKDGIFPSGNIIFSTSENMSVIENGIVTTSITSPPYWNLKDYFKKGQIGQESYDNYLCRMKKVFTQIYNSLSDNGSFWMNINSRVQRGKVVLNPKDLIEKCLETGFNYKGIFIWHKSSGIPTNNKNIVDRHEYLLIFSKSESLYLNEDVLKSYTDYENININGKFFWNINRKAGSVGKKFTHPAIYPNELVERIIKCTSSKGDLILDPFLGSGTTMISALNMFRSCIGYEYNEGFKDLMQSRFEKEIPGKLKGYIFFQNKTGDKINNC